jgi:hypothetical protein
MSTISRKKQLSILVVAAVLVLLLCQARMQSELTQFNQASFDLSNLQTGAPSIVLVTFLFGKEAAEKSYLRMFIETVKTSGVDIVIVGDRYPPFDLPPNVKVFLTTWDEF